MSTALLALVATISQADVEAALESLSWEPGCGSVVQAALSAAGPPSKHVAKTGRIRASALLPRLRFTVEKSFDYDKSLDQDDDGSISLAVDTDDDLEIRGYVEWDLSDLVFNPAETSAAGRRLEHARWRLDLASDVIEAYHERRELIVMRLLGILAPQDLVPAALRIEELTALLDALTGGWFSEELARRREAQPTIAHPQPVLPPPSPPSSSTSSGGSVPGS